MAGGEKKAIGEQRTLVFVDESGFYLLPAVLRTYAPVGQTPVLHERVTRSHLAAISGITPEEAVHDGARACLQRAGCGALPAALAASYPWTAVDHLTGRLFIAVAQ